MSCGAMNEGTFDLPTTGDSFGLITAATMRETERNQATIVKFG